MKSFFERATLRRNGDFLPPSSCVQLSRCKNESVERNDNKTATRKRRTPPHGLERKLLTALAAHAAPLGNVDLETLQSFRAACLEIMRPAVARYAGSFLESPGDAAIATFGGAVAVEEHARLATLAALEIMETLNSARAFLIGRYGFEFAIRIGLNTGLAIAPRGKGGLPPSGDAVNLASRLISLADAGQIIISDELWKVVNDYFVTSPLPEKSLQGIRMAPKLVLSVKPVRTRIEAEAAKGLTPFVGRQKELELLNDKLALARAGKGQVLLLAGEAGMGKSRVLLEFNRTVRGHELGWVAGRSISFGGQMAYLPIIDLLRQLFRISDGDDHAAIAARIDAETRALGARMEEAAPIFKYLLSLHGGTGPASEMDAQVRRVKTFEALRNLFLTSAAASPLVIVIEDLHWADKTSEEFLLTLADSMSMAPLLMLVTYRPGHSNPFPERSFITRAMLHPLNREESLTLTAQVRSEKAVPEKFRELVVAKAEGNPFFLEEMVKSLEESGALGGGAHASALRVPDTIQDVIMSRIDRLEESPRTTLQLAAVIGREFSVHLLETIADLNEPLASSLQNLKSLELIYERAIFPEPICIFRHALTQEVAYNSLLLQRRKELHCLVAAALEEIHASRLPEFYELLAYHYERGEEWERGLDYVRRAAEQCRRVGAYREEAIQLSRAMNLATKLGQSELITELRGRRGAARVKIGMFTDAKPDLEAALAELPVENRGRRAELLLCLAGASFWGLDTPGTQKYGAEGYAQAEAAGRDDLMAEGLTYLGASQQSLGNLADAAASFRTGPSKRRRDFVCGVGQLSPDSLSEWTSQ